MANMRIWCKKVFSALITNTSMTTLHDYSVRLRIKTNAALFLSKTNAHISEWIMIKFCLLPHCHHFCVAFLSIIFRACLPHDFFIVKLPIIHRNKLPMMFFIWIFCLFIFVIRLTLFKFKKFISRLFRQLRLLPTMILVFLFVHLMHRIN